MSDERHKNGDQFAIRNSQSAIDLSVIIVNWNAAAYLPAALDSLFAAQNGLNIEVWLIDNASGDDSLALVRENYPQVQVLANSENLGFAAANNQGIARAHGRYLLLLNPDTELPPTALLDLTRYLDGHPQVGVAGPRLQGKRGKVQGGAAGYDPSPVTLFNFATFLYRFFPVRFKGLWLPRSQYEQSEPIPVDWVSGACMLVRRSAIDAVGPMTERYFMYSEDVEWCRRIRAAGFGIVCLPAARVTHHIGGSSRQLGPDFYAHNVDSLDLDLRTRYAAPAVALMHLVGAFGFLLRYLIYQFQTLRWRSAAHADLRDLWAACLRTSLARTLRPADLRPPRQAQDEAPAPSTGSGQSSDLHPATAED